MIEQLIKLATEMQLIGGNSTGVRPETVVGWSNELVGLVYPLQEAIKEPLPEQNFLKNISESITVVPHELTVEIKFESLEKLGEFEEFLRSEDARESSVD